jgi:murein DD-endopeptidase
MAPPRQPCCLLLFWVALSIHASGLAAQSVEARAGRFFDESGWASYRIGLRQPLLGVVGLQFHGDLLKSVDSDAGMAGVGTDLTLFRSGGDGPYFLLGVSGGLGSETSNDLSTGWGSWSAGAGYDVFPVSFLSVGLEGRWRSLSLGQRNGFELGIGLTVHLGGSGPPSPQRRIPQAAEPTPESTPENPLQFTPAGLADSIVVTAIAAMGRPYQFGGTGAGGGGFDCSGLIQYAYKEHGIALARRSAEQAKEGKKVSRKMDQLRPADLLTFSNDGGRVTHVGMYVGNGRFIHSATRGVQISTLSAQDPYGRWWFTRWVGVRRIVR